MLYNSNSRIGKLHKIIHLASLKTKVHNNLLITLDYWPKTTNQHMKSILGNIKFVWITEFFCNFRFLSMVLCLLVLFQAGGHFLICCFFLNLNFAVNFKTLSFSFSLSHFIVWLAALCVARELGLNEDQWYLKIHADKHVKMIFCFYFEFHLFLKFSKKG